MAPLRYVTAALVKARLVVHASYGFLQDRKCIVGDPACVIDEPWLPGTVLGWSKEAGAPSGAQHVPAALSFHSKTLAAVVAAMCLVEAPKRLQIPRQ